jgi:hypothetical protein
MTDPQNPNAGRTDADSVRFAVFDRNNGLQEYRGSSRSNRVALYAPEIRPGRSGQTSVNLTAYMDSDIAEKSIALAKNRGITVSGLIASTMADLVADA